MPAVTWHAIIRCHPNKDLSPDDREIHEIQESDQRCVEKITWLSYAEQSSDNTSMRWYMVSLKSSVL